MSATIHETKVETRTAAKARALAARPRVFIVSDCSSFKPPFTAGGTERQLSALALQLERCGVEVMVFARACPPEPPADASTLRPDARTLRLGASRPQPGAGTMQPDASTPQPDASRLQPDAVTIQPCVAAPPRAAFRMAYVPPAPVPKGLGWAALRPNLRFIANVIRALLRKRREYDVVIVSGFRQLAPPMTLLARALGKRCIVRIEAAWDLDDEISPESGARIGGAAKRLVAASIRASRRLAFKLADYVVAFSDPLERRLLHLGVAPEKVKRIPNGVDTGRFAPVAPDEKAALRARLGLPADRTIFIYTGRLCRSKGVPELLRLWDRLAGSGAYLLIVGSGAGSHESCEAEVRDRASRHPDDIAWHGTVGNVAQYLQASDAFIFLSHFETFSLSILEAVCVGLPCIVSDVGCARQVVRHHETGAIVPTGAPPEAVLSEIEWLRSRRGDWTAMGALGRSSVAAEYGLATVAARYAALCGAPPPGGP